MSKGKGRHRPPNIVRKPPEPEPRARMVTATFQRQSISSPLPPPEWLAAYEQVHPGAANRILSIFEGQVAHRHEQERTATAALFGYMGRGQWVGAATMVAMVSLAALATVCNQPWVAGTAVTSTAGLVALFLSRRRQAKAKSEPEGSDEE